MNIEIGNKVLGTDVHGNNVSGVVTNVMPTFGIAQVRTGNDRLQITNCDFNTIKLKDLEL
jgi:hypothetical protein